MEIIQSKEFERLIAKCSPKVARSIYAKLNKLSDTGEIAGATKKIYKDVWELKVNNVRVLYCNVDGKIKLLKAFIKSTDKTPKYIIRFVQVLDSNVA